MKKEMSYIDSVHRDGRIWNLTVMVLLLAFPVAVACIFGVTPDWGALAIGLVATAPMYWAVGAIETVTFVPMLGAGGSYLSFVTETVIENGQEVKVEVPVSATSGLIPVFVLLASAIVMVICGLLMRKPKLKWLSEYALPISLVLGMAAAIPLTMWLG